MTDVEKGLKEPESPDELAEALAAAAPVGTYEVDLPGGRTLSFRRPSRYAEVRQFYRELVGFWDRWNDPDSLLEELRPYAPSDWSEAYAAYLVFFWAAPENRFSEKGVLALCRNPWVLDSLRNQIEGAQKAIDLAMLESLDAAKKGSTETTSTVSDSGSAETPFGVTPTP